MPVHSGNSEDCLRKILDQIVPDEPMIGPPVEPIKEPTPGYIDWQERLRTTEEMLQKLSNVYPFAWHGDR
jgi:hypothetical protein